MVSMASKIELRGKDLIIFTRNTSPYWQCRVKVDGHPAFDTSLKVTDQSAAILKAQDFYGEVQHKLKMGRALRSKPFKHIAKRFLDRLKAEHERGEAKKDKYLNAKSKFERYYIPFFGDKLIDEIVENDIYAYQEWRNSYWINGPGAVTNAISYERYNPRTGRTDHIRRPHKAVEKPASSTLRHEATDLRQLFRQAAIWGYIERSNIPEIKAPPLKTNRRPNFTRKEYRHLSFIAYERMQNAPTVRVKRDRAFLYYWMEILVNTGMRVGEARNLKWKDVRYHSTENGDTVVQLWVSGKGKKRELIAMPDTKLFLEELAKFSKFTQPDDYVFSGRNGEPIKRLNGGFNQLLKAAELEFDNYGDKRTPYSLRHTYATFALIEGQVNVYTLAVNMGTSVEMIEKHYGHVKPMQAYKELTRRFKL